MFHHFILVISKSLCTHTSRVTRDALSTNRNSETVSGIYEWLLKTSFPLFDDKCKLLLFFYRILRLLHTYIMMIHIFCPKMLEKRLVYWKNKLFVKMPRHPSARYESISFTYMYHHVMVYKVLWCKNSQSNQEHRGEPLLFSCVTQHTLPLCPMQKTQQSSLA